MTTEETAGACVRHQHVHDPDCEDCQAAAAFKVGDPLPTSTNETGSALDRAVRVPLQQPDHPVRFRSFEANGVVKPSDVVWAHNAQTPDPADHLITQARCVLTHDRDMAFIREVEGERDQARAEVERLTELLDVARDDCCRAHDASEVAREALRRSHERQGGRNGTS
jgi:hypothetical protein